VIEGNTHKWYINDKLIETKHNVNTKRAI
jgi:hypothetical protein